jgi:hypothetical protein
MLAHRVLVKVSHRKGRARELFLRQRKQEIGLIFSRIGTAPQHTPATCVALDSCIVTRGERVGAKSDRPFEQRRKLQVRIAVRARNRSTPRSVFADEIRHHLLVEAILEVQHVMRNANGARHPSRVVQIVNRAAGAKPALPLGLVIELHRHTNHVVTLLS